MSRWRSLHSKALIDWKALDLRFSDIDQEAEFKQHLEETMAVRVTIFAAIYTVVIVIQHMFIQGDGNPGMVAFFVGWRSPEELIVSLETTILVLYVVLLFVGGTSLYLKASLCCVNWETLIIVCFSCHAILMPWSNLWIVAKLYDRDPNDYWMSKQADVPHNDGGSQALRIDVVCTALCLFIPVRIFLKWIPLIIGTVSYFLVGICVGSSHPRAFFWHGNSLIVLVALALVGAYHNERISRSEFLSQRLVQRKTHELEMTHASHSDILHRLTDSIVYLGHDLTILDTDSRFPAVAARASKDSVVGCNFCDFLASEEDCNHFKNALLGSHEDERKCEDNGGMVQVHLRDRYNHHFGVYAYHAGIFGSERGRCHTVAIVEVGERGTFTPEQQTTQFLPFEVHGVDAVTVKNEDSASNSDTETSTISALEGIRNNIAVWVNIDSDDLLLEQCSVEFTVFGPIPQGTGLQDLLQFDEGTSNGWGVFLDWIHRSLEQLLQISDHGTRTTSFDRRLEVRICNSSHSNVAFKAKCQIDIDTPLPSVLKTRTHDLVRLIFADVRRSRTRRKRGRRDIGRPRHSSLLKL